MAQRRHVTTVGAMRPRALDGCALEELDALGALLEDVHLASIRRRV